MQKGVEMVRVPATPISRAVWSVVIGLLGAAALLLAASRKPQAASPAR